MKYLKLNVHGNGLTKYQIDVIRFFKELNHYDFLKFLGKDVMISYVNNILYQKPTYWKEIVLSTDYGWIIDRSFNWARTKQGHHFWAKLNREWRERF